jgi:RNA polymerase sigma-70 factor, ECF subfamily
VVRGNYSPIHDITRMKKEARTMQDRAQVFVLHSEATMPGAGSDVPISPDEPSSPVTRTDEQLMIDFSHGSADAFAELFARYQQPVFGFFRRRISDPARAEELTQDTFLAVVHASKRYVPSATFRTWLYAIGYTILRADRRKSAFRALFHAESTSAEPAKRNTVEIDLWMRDAFDKLDRHDREILLLREFEQLSYAEIAEVLQLPVNTVRSRLFRARAALRELLVSADPQPSSNNFVNSEAEEGL